MKDLIVLLICSLFRNLFVYQYYVNPVISLADYKEHSDWDYIDWLESGCGDIKDKHSFDLLLVLIDMEKKQNKLNNRRT